MRIAKTMNSAHFGGIKQNQLQLVYGSDKNLGFKDKEYIRKM